MILRLRSRLQCGVALLLMAIAVDGSATTALRAQAPRGIASRGNSPHARPDVGRPRVQGGAGIRAPQGATTAARDTAARDTAGGDTVTFAHDRHASLDCLTCHSSRSRRGGVVTATARDCAGCHHADTAAAPSCARCHQPTELAGRLAVRASVALSVWRAPETRTLGFEHPRHQRFACADCHATDRSRSFVTTCASCHAEHHEATRDCGACHSGAREAHGREVHVTGCATAGCHVREASAAVTPVRAVCLACHNEQARHMRGRECATCHLSQWRSAAPRGDND